MSGDGSRMAGSSLFRALNFLVLEAFFDPGACQHIRATMRAAPAEGARVGVVATLDEQQRRTRAVTVPAELRRAVADRFDTVRDRAATHFGVTLSTQETPQFLLYRPGDFFIRHMDRDRDGGNQRQVSLIAFLNADFEGGGLTFLGGVDRKLLRLTLAPAAGLVVLFPANWIHQVEPVTGGERFTVVSWFA